MKVLVVKPSSLGDVIHGLPVARLIRRHHPDAQIDWFLNRELTPLLEGDPDLHRVIPFDRRAWTRPTGWPDAVGTVRALRQTRYDWVIDLQSLARSAAISWLARGAFTIGLDDPREGAPAFYDVAVPRRSWDMHAVDWYLDVVRRLGVPVSMDFAWLPRREAVAAPVQARWFSKGERWIALQPGARWNSKRWPVELFGDLARRLTAADPGLRVAVLGGRDDQPLGRAIAEAGGAAVENLCGRLSLPELVEWLRLASALVTNDTGPMHIAVAVGLPVLALMGPTAPERTGPYGRLPHCLRVPLPCAPCLKSECRLAESPLACLRGITPETVARRVLELLPASSRR